MLGRVHQGAVFVVEDVDAGVDGVGHHRGLGPVEQQVAGDRERSLLHGGDRQGDHLKLAGWACYTLHPQLHADAHGAADLAPVAGLDGRVFSDRADGADQTRKPQTLRVHRPAPGEGRPSDSRPPVGCRERGVVDHHAPVAGTQDQREPARSRQPRQREPVAGGGEGSLGGVVDVGLGGHLGYGR